jgi:molybdopterin converting factor small subunit
VVDFMQIHVRFAEPFWRVVGQRNITLEIVEGARVGDLMTLLIQQYPALEHEFEKADAIVFVGDEGASPETTLSDGVLVHLIWPVAGG